MSVVKGDTQFKKTKGWIGAYYTRGSVGSAVTLIEFDSLLIVTTKTRFQARHADKGYAFSLAQKLTYSHRDVWGGAYVDLNLSDQKVSQFNAVVGYNVNKNIQIYAEQ